MKDEEKLQGHSSQGTKGGLNSGRRIGVLLIHSLGGSPIEMRFIAHKLTGSGFVVSCPLLQGLASGTDVSGLSTWHDWFAAVEAAHVELEKQCDAVIVGGMSAGGMLALRLAALRPQSVRGVMLFAPTLWPNGWSIPWYFNFFKLVNDRYSAKMFNFRTRVPHGIKDERVCNFIVDLMKAETSGGDVFARSGSLVYQFRRLVQNVRPMLGTIKQRTMIFHPRRDDQSDLRNTFRLQRELGGLVDVCVLDDSYHMVTLDRQKNLVIERTAEFAKAIARQIEAEAQVAMPAVVEHHVRPAKGIAEQG